MPISCSAYGCTNRWSKHTKLQFHRFPLSNPVRLKQWVNAVRRLSWHPTKSSFLCSNHFAPDSYKSTSKRYLSNDALPSIFNFSVQLVKKESVTKKILVPEPAHKSRKVHCNKTIQTCTRKINDELQKTTPDSFVSTNTITSDDQNPDVRFCNEECDISNETTNSGNTSNILVPTNTLKSEDQNPDVKFCDEEFHISKEATNSGNASNILVSANAIKPENPDRTICNEENECRISKEATNKESASDYEEMNENLPENTFYSSDFFDTPDSAKEFVKRKLENITEHYEKSQKIIKLHQQKCKLYKKQMNFLENVINDLQQINSVSDDI